MSKRRVSIKQLGRIHGNQAERQNQWRSGHGQERELNDNDYGAEQPGLVTAHFGRMTEVEAIDGHRIRCQLRQHLGDLVCGDKVLWRQGPNRSGVITGVLPRRSILGRHDQHGDIKAVAANIDQILIVVASEPELILYLLDSYIVAAELLNITPVIVANKMDLLSIQKKEKMLSTLHYYQALGYRVVQTACPQRHGLDELHDVLKDKVNVFVGQSGVGKSTLIAHILPTGVDIKTGELSRGQGQHTTTTARLYHLPLGGDLIDSPGIREFGLGKLTIQQIEQGFVDFHPILGQCKFRNCQHAKEPHCAIRNAVEDNKIARNRLNSFHHLLLGENFNSVDEANS